MSSTSRDVARAAGVSVATVSRVFSAHGSVAEGTRQRVLEHARRLGYSPNAAARRLITGRSGSIGLVVPDLANPFFADIAKGVQRRVRETGHSVLVADVDELPRLEPHTLQHLARQVDGLVWAAPRTNPGDVIGDLEVPVVLLLRQAPGVASVSADYGEGMRQALVNLRALGHTCVAYADGPPQSWSGELRRASLAEHSPGLGIDIVELGSVPPGVDGGLMAADLCLASAATAVIAYNDIVAIGMMQRLAARGVRVPDQMSVVGCDNTLLSQVATPALTTIDVPRFEAGQEAVTLLDQLLTSPEVPTEDVVLPTALVIRASTAPPGPSHG